MIHYYPTAYGIGYVKGNPCQRTILTLSKHASVSRTSDVLPKGVFGTEFHNLSMELMAMADDLQHSHPRKEGQRYLSPWVSKDLGSEREMILIHSTIIHGVFHMSLDDTLAGTLCL
jgi:hypothetical protein